MTGSELAIVIGAMLLGAFVKGAVGTGLPTVAIPVMAGFIGVEEAVVIMAIPTVLTNSWLLWAHRGYVGQSRDLPSLMAFGIVGAVVGAWVLSAVEPVWLMFALAGVVVAYVGLFVFRPQLEVTEVQSRRLSPPVGAASGVLQGATGISGPLLTTYAHALRLPRRAFLFQLAAQIEVFAVAQVAAFAFLGMYSLELLASSLLAIVPAAIALPLGMRLSARLPLATFERLVLVFLVAMAAKLVFDGITGA